jgi:hypothetical protein
MRVYPRNFTSTILPDFQSVKLLLLLQLPAAFHHMSKLEAEIAANDSLLGKVNVDQMASNFKSI